MDADFSEAWQKFGRLKGPDSNDVLTISRDLWPKLFYLLYCIF